MRKEFSKDIAVPKVQVLYWGVNFMKITLTYLSEYIIHTHTPKNKNLLYRKSCLVIRRTLQDTNELGGISNTLKTVEK